MATVNSPAPNASSSLRDLLSTAGSTISIAAERGIPNAYPHAPAFLHGYTHDAAHPGPWNDIILPLLVGLTFRLDSVLDIHFASEMMASPALPGFLGAVTRLQFPKFFWFSGISDTRPHNPYCQLVKNLPGLRDLEITMHTAGTTLPMWADKAAFDEPHTPQDRKVMSKEDVASKYELDTLFKCRSLKSLRMLYIECSMTKECCKKGDPVAVLRGLRDYMVEKFAQKGQEVVVELVETEAA